METLPIELNFMDLFLGGMNLHEFTFSVFLVFIGALLYVLNKIKNRKDQTSIPSFKIWFEHKDNLLAIPMSIILTYISVRFYDGYKDWMINKMTIMFGEGFVAVPYFLLVISGFCQHWLSIKINKLAKKF